MYYKCLANLEHYMSTDSIFLFSIWGLILSLIGRSRIGGGSDFIAGSLIGGLIVCGGFGGVTTVAVVPVAFIMSGCWVICIVFGNRVGGVGLGVGDGSGFIGIIVFAGLLILSAQTILGLVLGFEIMLWGALGLLRSSSKSERSIEALMEMFFWALVGSSFIVVGLCIGEGFEIMISIGLAVKVPVWPFSSWLLKAHVEASTEFSIVLSGFLVKFGLMGLIRVLGTSGGSSGSYVLLISSIMGVLDSLCRLPGQVDFKRIVALTTVVESNWMLTCFLSGSSELIQVGHWLIFMHCLTTTIEFYLAESIVKRYGTRSIGSVRGIAGSYPNMFFACVGGWAITVGFPGTSIFASKVVFLISMLQFNFFIFMFWALIMLIIIPLYFTWVWVPLWFGQGNGGGSDLGKHELTVLGVSLLCSLILGFYPTLIA